MTGSRSYFWPRLQEARGKVLWAEDTVEAKAQRQKEFDVLEEEQGQ